MTIKRILFVLGTLAVGGTERQVIEILRHLSRQRFAPVLYLIYRQGELLDQVPPDVPVFSYWERHRPPQLNWPGRILGSQARDLASIIRRERIDLVYERTSNVTLTVAPATRRTGTKRVSAVVADPREEFASSHRRFARLKWQLLRRAYHSANRVVAVSEGVRNGLIEYFGLPGEQVCTCYNLFDVEVLEQLAGAADPGFPHDRFNVVCVGRLQREKGQRFLIEAVADVVHRRQLRQLLLWLVGAGPDTAALQELVQARELADHVRLVGYQANPQPYFKHAQLACLPSLFEGMPNALVEAVLAGTPVIASDCPSGPREILCGGKHGVLVPPGDARRLADALEDAIRHPAAWAARVPAALRHVQQTYSLAAGLARLESLFDEVLQDRASD